MASDCDREPRAASAVQSVDRAVSVLEILAREGEVGVTEIAAELGVHKSTAFRLLGVLEERGLVGQTEDRGKYHLGLGIIRLAGATAARLDVTQESRQVCEELAQDLGETVNVAISDLEAAAAVNITQARGTAAVTSQNWIGRRTPLHATSSGKVLLAHMRPDEVRRVLGRRLEGFTDHTITSSRRLRAELAVVAERGFAACVEELEIGLNALAAPIRSYEGMVIAAISVSGPSYRLTQERLPEVAEQVVAAGAEVSRRMGYA